MAENLKISDLVKLQIFSLDQLDLETIGRLEPVLKRARDNIVVDLNKLGKKSFSYRQQRQTYHLINNALIHLHNQNVQDLSGMAEDYSSMGIELAEREVGDLSKEVGMSVPNLNRDLVALDTNSYLLNTMESSLLEYSAGLRSQISRFLTNSVIQRKTGYETVSKASKFIDLKIWKIWRIVRTEMSRIMNETKLLTYKQFDKENFKGQLLKRMFHPMDNRTADDSKQWAKADPAIPLNQNFRLKLANGKVQEGPVPPLRPNDRAVLMPFHKKWKE